MVSEICECVVLIEQVTEVVVIQRLADLFYTASVPRACALAPHIERLRDAGF